MPLFRLSSSKLYLVVGVECCTYLSSFSPDKPKTQSDPRAPSISPPTAATAIATAVANAMAEAVAEASCCPNDSNVKAKAQASATEVKSAIATATANSQASASNGGQAQANAVSQAVVRSNSLSGRQLVRFAWLIHSKLSSNFACE